jgi:hypothetical protein
VEACSPPDALAHAGLDRLVAFSSFPDSMSHHLPRHRSSVHDSLFSFRLPDPSARRGFLYGFVFNRQRQDERLPRGGEQKSVVILSHAPYSSLFRLLLQILGPLCFDIGHAALTMVASHVAAWPAPAPGCPMELPIGSAALRVHLPPAPDDPGPPPALLPANPSVPYGLSTTPTSSPPSVACSSTSGRYGSSWWSASPYWLSRHPHPNAPRP